MRMTGFRSDLRFVTRALTRGWRFTSGVVLTLALGIGLGAPVLGLADQFFLRPPPGVADPDRVVRLIVRGMRNNGPYTTDGLTGLDYTAIARARTLSGVAGWIDYSRSLGRGAEARTIPVTLASASYFTVLGVRPFLGRFYQAAEDVEGASEAPCVVSYRFWQTALDGDPRALGRSLQIGEVRYTIVGVAPEGFNGLGLRTVDAWLPLRVGTREQQGDDPELWTTDHSSWLRIVAHLAPGASLAQATAEAEVLYRTAGERTRDRELRGTYRWDPLQPGRSSLGSTSARISLWLGGGAVLLLVLITANLVNLFVARNAAHIRQTAVRLALGGNWRHLLRLRLLEAAVLGVAAAAVGLAITGPAVRVARALLLPGMVWARPALDPRVAVLAFVIAFGIGAIVAGWTTVQALRSDPLALLRGAGSPAMSGSRRSDALRRTLLVLQAAVFAVLLTGASAFVVSLRRASSVSFGFDIGSVISARIPMPADVPRSDARALMERARDGVAALPGVESASLGYMEPFQNNTSVPISVPGSTVTPPYTMFDMVTPEYLHTFGVRMRDGRWFTASDGAASEPVIVINEALEHIYWPTGGAVGRCMRVGADSMPCRIIVGVVRDFRVTGGADDAARPIYYLPYAQTAGFRQLPTLFVRPRGEPATISQSVRQALQSLQPNLQAVSVHPVSDNVTWLTAPLRLGAAAFTAFGIVAAIVGAVGLYSVLAFMIVERSRAYAIRLAIGAAPVRLARSVVRYALVTVGVGMIAGAVLLVPLARVLEPLLFHTRVLDVRALLAVALLGLLTTLVATISPVRAVVRTDVMRVLREQ